MSRLYTRYYKITIQTYFTNLCVSGIQPGNELQSRTYRHPINGRCCSANP